VSVILTFLPINFLHPVRVKRLRRLNMAIFLAWSGLGIYALLLHFQTPVWVSAAVILSGLYLYCIGAVLQWFPQFGK
jgi:phosphatidylcholine synthase